MTDERGAARLPTLHDLAVASGMLTALPFARAGIGSAAAARATLFFPLVGAAIGALLLAINRLLADHLPAPLGAALLVIVWEAIAGLPAMRAGTAPLWTVAMIALLVLKAVGLAVAVSSRPAALLFAPLLARWSMVVLAVGARDAAAPARKLNAAVTFREFALTSVLTCALVFTIAEAFGILLVVAVAALTLALRLLQHRQPGGTSWPLLLASAELVEVLVVGVVLLTGRR